MSSDERPKKILVIGSAPHSREVTAIGWYACEPRNVNIADYDVVIVNLSGEKCDYEWVTQQASSTRESFTKLLESGGELFIISDPDTEKYWWCPVQFGFVKEAGDTIEVGTGKTARQLRRYMDNVKSWTFYLFRTVNVSQVQKYYRQRWSSADVAATGKCSVIAQNRYERMLAIVLSLTVSEPRYDSARGAFRDYELLRWGPICILPPPTECSMKEGIDILLADLFGIRAEKEPPPWVNQYKVAGQAEAEKTIEGIEARIAREKEKLEQTKADVEAITKFRQLLYEQGEPLQEIVWTTLDKLGAKVTRPIVKNEADGWIKVPLGEQTLEGVLEITGRSKSVTLGDAKQLDTWVANGLKKGKKYKGLLIGNHYIEQPPDARDAPFPDNLIGYATDRKFCLLTTVELFNAYCACKEGRLAKDTFWQKVFHTVGPCKIV